MSEAVWRGRRGAPSKRWKRRVIAQQLVTERKVRGKGKRTVNGREEDEEEEKSRKKE